MIGWKDQRVYIQTQNDVGVLYGSCALKWFPLVTFMVRGLYLRQIKYELREHSDYLFVFFLFSQNTRHQ